MSDDKNGETDSLRPSATVDCCQVEFVGWGASPRLSLPEIPSAP
jgi:hypothetical protein